jgi:hypothetical protein
LERKTHKKHAKDGGDEACEIKRPLAANDIGDDAKRKSANTGGYQCPVAHSLREGGDLRQTSIGARKDKTLSSGWHTHFLTASC